MKHEEKSIRMINRTSNFGFAIIRTGQNQGRLRRRQHNSRIWCTSAQQEQ